MAIRCRLDSLFWARRASKMQCSVLLFCSLLAPVVCASRIVMQQAASSAFPSESALPPTGASSAARSSPLPSEKITVQTAQGLLDSVRQGYQFIEITAHLNLAGMVGHSRDFFIISSGKTFLKGACEKQEEAQIDFNTQEGQCILTLGQGATGFLAALGPEVVLSNLVVSRSPTGTSQPTITATDSSIFMESSAIIVDTNRPGTAQGLRLRNSRALLTGVHLEGNMGSRGGAIDAIGSSVTIHDSLLQQNIATEKSGGALYMAFSSLRFSASTCINNAAVQGGGGAIALESPTDAELQNVTFSLNEATVMGGAALLTGSLGNNTLRLYGSTNFQANTANGIRQDITRSSAGTVTFDRESGAENLVGEGAGGFAWQPIVSAVQLNASTAAAYPPFVDREEFWITDAEQVFVSNSAAVFLQAEEQALECGVIPVPETETDDRVDPRVVMILSAICGTLLLCTLSLTAVICIMRHAAPCDTLPSSRSTTTAKTSSIENGKPFSQVEDSTHAPSNEDPTSGGGGSHMGPNGIAISHIRTGTAQPHGWDAGSTQQPRGAIDAGPDSAAQRASWYGGGNTGAGAAVPPLRVGMKKSPRAQSWRRMFGGRADISEPPELNTITEEEEPYSAGMVHMHSPVIAVPTTVHSSSSDSESELGAGAEFQTTVTVQREGTTAVSCRSPDSSSIGSTSMYSLSSTLTHDSSDQSGSPVARSRHRVQRVLMTDVSPLSNHMDSLDSFPGLQWALISEPLGVCRHRQGAAADRRATGPTSNSSVRSHDSNTSRGSKQSHRVRGLNSGPCSGERVQHPPRPGSGPWSAEMVQQPPRPQSGPWSGERVQHLPSIYEPSALPSSQGQWQRGEKRRGDKLHHRPTNAPIDSEFGMSVIDGLQHRMQSLNSKLLGGPTSGVIDEHTAHVVDSMRSDVSRGGVTDGHEATSTHCSNTFFLVPPRLMPPSMTGPHTQPDSRDLAGLTDELIDKETHMAVDADSLREISN